MSSYDLSRAYFDWSFENPEHCNPVMAAIYFYAIDKNNKLGWKEKFGFPSQDAMDTLGIKSYKTYILNLRKLIEFGFITMVQKSTNQNTANIISLTKPKKKTQKSALDRTIMMQGKYQSEYQSDDQSESKATAKASPKQLPKQVQSKYSIDKPLNKETNKPLNQETIKLISIEISDSENLEVVSKNQKKEKKENSAKEKKDSPHNGMVKVWYEWFEEQNKTEPKMIDKDFAALKRIREYFTKQLIKKNNYSDENLYQSFRIILDAVKKHEFVSKNVSIPIIESKINELITIARNPQQTKTQIQEASTMSALDILNRKTLGQ